MTFEFGINNKGEVAKKIDLIDQTKLMSLQTKKEYILGTVDIVREGYAFVFGDNEETYFLPGSELVDRSLKLEDLQGLRLKFYAIDDNSGRYRRATEASLVNSS